MRHALGLTNPRSKNVSYRNHFVTGEGSKDYEHCQELCRMGFMENTGKPSFCSDECFVVTPSGVAEEERLRQPEPKLTRSQVRYREYLKVGDCFESFRHFLLYQKRKQSSETP